MVNDKELAAVIAREIFIALSEPWDECQRIEGKGGTYTVGNEAKTETSLGGFCEESLAKCIERTLSEHRSY